MNIYQRLREILDLPNRSEEYDKMIREAQADSPPPFIETPPEMIEVQHRNPDPL